jgi:hypothetical protein
MTSPTLQYFTPAPERRRRWQLLRFFFLGPFTGALVGFVQTLAAAACWVWHGEPDFFFRGRSGVEAHFELFMFAGGFVGFWYAWALIAFEYFAGRRIRAKISIPVTAAVAFVIAGIVVETEFRRRSLSINGMEELAAIVCGLIVSVMTSKREPAGRDPD